ncbi:hypothetical protein CBS101457_001707 [Exobasidium rhododendri]|nr:hypothetical protein CBS101457_001707 [Exobasidium rhododendri]
MSKSIPGSHSPALRGGSAAALLKGGNAQQTSAATPAAPTVVTSTMTPTTATAEPSGLLKDLKAHLSKPVRVGLKDGKQLSGLLWAFDAGMGILVLEIPKSVTPAVSLASSEDYPTTAAAFPTSTLSSMKVAAQGGDASGSRTNFHIVKLRTVSKVEKLQGPNASTLETANMTELSRDINVAAAEAREKAATSEAMKRYAKVGVGVSLLGQDVFDALSKTLPCRWSDRHIIVMDEIVISPDGYDVASVPKYQLSTLQALADGKEVQGVPEDGKAKATRWQRVSKVLDGERKKILAKRTVP